MNDRDLWTLKAMEKYGGGFVRAIAGAARAADAPNLALIKTTWNEYWDDYEQQGKRLEETGE